MSKYESMCFQALHQIGRTPPVKTHVDSMTSQTLVRLPGESLDVGLYSEGWWVLCFLLQMTINVKLTKLCINRLNVYV